MTDRDCDESTSSSDEQNQTAEDREPGNRESDHQFRTLVQAVEEYAIFRLDPEGTVVSWNSGAERLKGYTADEILGEHFSTFYMEDDRTVGVPGENLARAADHGSVEDEGWRVRADGSRFWANVTITAIRDANGHLDGFAKVTRDMTDRKQAREERQLHLSVSRSVAEAATFEDGLQAAVTDICEWTDWVVGQAWVPTKGASAERLPVSRVQRADFDPFEEASREYTFGPGEGIPGQVIASGEPVWFPDVTAVSESVYPRSALAADVGLKAGLGVPVIVDGDVAVVLEFYMAEQRAEDERLVELITTVTADLGSLVSRKQIQDELTRERELLVEMMEAAPVGISVLTPDGDIERMNTRARNFRIPQGKDADQRDASTFYDETGTPIPPDELPFAMVVESGSPIYDWTAQVELPDGKRKWLSVDAAPIIGEDGEIKRVVIVDEDVTELGEQYRAISEAITDVIITINENSVIRSANPAIEDVFGYTRDEITGESLTKLMPEGYSEQHQAAISRYLETGERTLDWDYVELPGQHADGSQLPLALSFSEIRYRGDQFFTGVIRDISDRKEYQRRLEESNERLESLASMIAHELRNPVTIGQIYSQQLPTETAPDAVAYVEEAFERIENMIDVLLVLTQGRKPVGERNPVSLADVSRNAWAEVNTPDAAIQIEIDDEIRGDETYLWHLFRNLFENAVRHGGADVTVQVGRMPNGFYVADDGCGIPPEDRDTVFDAGFTTAADEGGTGLGLAFVRELADVYEWTCAVSESNTGGARIEFRNVDFHSTK